LHVKSIFTDAYEGFDLQIPFQGLEEVIDWPAVLIDGRYRIGSELAVIGEQNDFALIVTILNNDSA
jgi:hypothetical protein